MHRFFIPPSWIDGDRVTLSANLVHQLCHVLRLKPGDGIVVLDNRGWEYEVELTALSRKEVLGQVREKRPGPTEARAKITLYQGLLKSHHFEFVLEKGTELGVAGFVPILCQRCQVEAPSLKLARWQRIIREAAEQSRRSRLPLLHPPLPFDEACRTAQGLSLMPWEGEAMTSLRTALSRHPQETTINLFIGPEGGFSPQEVALARGYGIITVTLGSRILRAETAALVAAAAMLYEKGDLGQLPAG